MHRRNFLRNSTLTLGALTLFQKNLLSAFMIDPFKITMLTKRIGIFTEKGGTILFYLGKTEIIVVDAQFPEQSQHLINALRTTEKTPFGLLINTHHHGDHTSGNISFKGIVLHVLAHENSLKNQRAVAIANKTEDKQLYPDMTFSTEWCQRAGNQKFCLHYYGPGHTDGDALVHLTNANIVHMGDLVFNRRHPYVDRSAGANMKNWMIVLDRALNTFDGSTRFVYGHSGDGYDVVGKSDDLKAFRDYLGNTLHFVEGEMKAGKTKDEILKNKVIPGSEQWKGDGIERPLTAAYEELLPDINKVTDQ
jgi:cyclase